MVVLFLQSGELKINEKYFWCWILQLCRVITTYSVIYKQTESSWENRIVYPCYALHANVMHTNMHVLGNHQPTNPRKKDSCQERLLSG